MSHTWKLMPLAVFAAIGAIMLLPGNVTSPTATRSAEAALDCDATKTRLRIEIRDDNTGNLVTVAGSSVLIDPDPRDGTGSRTYVDNGSGDDSATIGRIDEDEACRASANDDYEITLTLPDALEDCSLDDDTQTSGNGAGTTTVTFILEDCPGLTPTATATGTVGAARTVTVQSANQSLGCANTTIITITVRGANGQAVAAGTAVTITASIGAVSPTSGQTTADGSVFVFYTAPQNQGGTATITALAGSASGTANITINCNVAPTQAPPPTTAPSTGIQPPNTGDGGLSTGTTWHTYAGIAMIIASVIATLVVVRPRA
jgi:hypothetical protein